MQSWFNIQKSTKVSHYFTKQRTKKKDKNHMIQESNTFEMQEKFEYNPTYAY